MIANGSEADLADLVGEAEDSDYQFGGDPVGKPGKRRIGIEGKRLAPQ